LKNFVNVDYNNSPNISDDSINTIINNIANTSNSIYKRRNAYAELLKYYHIKVKNNPSFDRATALSII
jgi:flagellar basal body rod protein FlgG